MAQRFSTAITGLFSGPALAAAARLLRRKYFFSSLLGAEVQFLTFSVRLFSRAAELSIQPSPLNSPFLVIPSSPQPRLRGEEGEGSAVLALFRNLFCRAEKSLRKFLNRSSAQKAGANLGHRAKKANSVGHQAYNLSGRFNSCQRFNE